MAGKWYTIILTITFCGASDRYQGTSPWVTRGSMSDRYEVIDGYTSGQAARSAM